MKKSNLKKLSLNKFTVSKLNNADKIRGGSDDKFFSRIGCTWPLTDFPCIDEEP